MSEIRRINKLALTAVFRGQHLGQLLWIHILHFYAATSRLNAVLVDRL